MKIKNTTIETPLGLMTVIGSEKSLYLLDFTDNGNLSKKINHIEARFKTNITQGKTEALNQIESELKDYFKGSLKDFKTCFDFEGSSFQKQAWQEIMNIPYGCTLSYSTQAANIGSKGAYRAVGSANGANFLSIIIPCHRIINKGGSLGGYGGGLHRKKWLLEHEKSIFENKHI